MTQRVDVDSFQVTLYLLFWDIFYLQFGWILFLCKTILSCLTGIVRRSECLQKDDWQRFDKTICTSCFLLWSCFLMAGITLGIPWPLCSVVWWCNWSGSIHLFANHHFNFEFNSECWDQACNNNPTNHLLQSTLLNRFPNGSSNLLVYWSSYAKSRSPIFEWTPINYFLKLLKYFAKSR